MPFNGSGSFSPYTPGNPVIPGTVISSTAFNATQQDIAAGLSNAVTRDGQSPLTANLPAAGRKITGLGAGVVAGDSLRFEQLFSQGTEQDIASAATVDIGGLNTTIARITGTTTITSFGTNYNGPRYVRFAGALTLTHNATTLILPGGANITTAAGDRAILTPVGSPGSGWQVLSYQKADGTAVAGAAASTIALTNDATTNAPHYLTFADGTAGQENLKTDTAKLAYNPSTGALSAASFIGDLAGSFNGANQSLTSSGFQKLPGGLILQWGSGVTSGAGTLVVTFPIAFPSVLASGSALQISGNSYLYRTAGSTSGMTLQSGVAASNSVQWFALGY